MRAIVTGAAGFIGSHLVDALVARGDDVVGIDNLSTGRRERANPGAPLVVEDIRKGDALRAAFSDARPQAVFHLAAQADVRVSVERPDYDADVNVLGTIQVLEAAREHGAQVILSSTGGAIYGECERPAREDDELAPFSPYGTSKLAAEQYLATTNRLHGTGHVALRYGNVYGPRQDPHGEAGVVAIFFGRFAEDRAATIFGTGRQTRDYVYVGDVVTATMAAFGRSGGVFNVGTGRETSVLELHDACRRVSGADLEPEFAAERLGELERSVLDTGLASRELGFEAAVALDDGLARTWASIREGEPEAAAN
ncbi:MAG TPA: NAD-dependent epimerase/dehydratase family protein [Gaiellaceae bacterium]